MQLNKILKGLLIAVPVMTLAACSSSSDIDEGAANQSNQSAVEQSTNTDTVEVATISPEQQAEEQLRQKYEALRQEQIIYFDFDKATVENKYAELLRAHAEFLVQNPSVKVLIEGHADERGTPEYNIALGEHRGQAVEKYLQDKRYYEAENYFGSHDIEREHPSFGCSRSCFRSCKFTVEHREAFSVTRKHDAVAKLITS